MALSSKIKFNAIVLYMCEAFIFFITWIYFKISSF